MVWYKTLWKTDSVMNVRHTANEKEHCNRKCTRAKQCRSIQSMFAEHNFNVSALRTTLSSSNLFCSLIARKSSFELLEGKDSLESTDPRESEIRAHLRP